MLLRRFAYVWLVWGFLESICLTLGCSLAQAQELAPELAILSIAPESRQARQEVLMVEQAFARTMFARDFKAFSEFIAVDAVFFTGKKVLRGKQQILDGWEHFFEASIAPFSWKPDEVETILSGELASSSGPVYDAKGLQIARFVSIWRKQGDRWQIVFDRGVDICLCKKD